MAVNDFYFGDDDFAWPMGNIQLLGKLQAGMLSAAKPYMPKPVLTAMANRSVDWWVMSEDLPDPENRVFLGSDGKIRVRWKPNNRVAHQELIGRAARMMRPRWLCLRVHRNPRHRHQFASMRHGALRGRSGDICTRSLLQISRSRKPLRDGFVLLSFVNGDESGADHLRAGAAGRGSSAGKASAAIGASYHDLGDWH